MPPLKKLLANFVCSGIAFFRSDRYVSGYTPRSEEFCRNYTRRLDGIYHASTPFK